MKKKKNYETPELKIIEFTTRRDTLVVASGSNVSDYTYDDSHTFEEE